MTLFREILWKKRVFFLLISHFCVEVVVFCCVQFSKARHRTIWKCQHNLQRYDAKYLLIKFHLLDINCSIRSI